KDAYGRKNIAVMWNGVPYRSITKAAEALRVSVPEIHRRYHAGYTCDADMPGQRNLRVACEWNGIWYGSMQAAAEALGIANTGMYKRLVKGYTCDEDPKKKHIRIAL